MIQNSLRVFVLIAISLALKTQIATAQKTESEPTAKSSEVVEATDIGTAPDQKAIDNLKKFLVGSKWNGTFTMSGKGDKLHTEEYEITSAEKEPTGDEWVLITKIKYMKKDVKVPVPLSIKWLDRTPIIVVDQLTIPGMGTFDSRVIIRKGMYAGTWAHGKVGGHLFGDITTAAAAAGKAESDEKQ
jgi:hypothetical protein